MFDFIRMWLLLRALDEQEDRQVVNEEQAAAYYSLNKFPYVDKHKFAVAISNLSLLPFCLPLWLRVLIFKSDPIIRGGTVPDRSRLRRVYLLLGEASEYIQSPSVKNIDEDKDELEGKIRLCTEKDLKASFLTSYLGGLNILLTSNKAAWSFLAVTLSPQWVPWLVNLFCKYAPLLNFCVRIP